MTRRRIQLALALLWLLDGALQLQPIMLTRRFATGVIAPAAAGTPAPVHRMIAAAASVVAAQPVAFDAAFAAVQLLLGIGLLLPRTARPALAGSVAWSLGVWVLGEGAGGLLGPGASLLAGAPGAALLYAALAVVAWPGREGSRRPPAPSVAGIWAVLWLGLAALQLAPGDGSGRAMARALTANRTSLPAPLAGADRSLAHAAVASGAVSSAVLGGLLVLVALGALGPGAARRAAALAGGAVGLATWVLPEAFGAIASGTATDPNTGPVLVLLAAALWACPAPPWRRRSPAARPAADLARPRAEAA